MRHPEAVAEIETIVAIESASGADADEQLRALEARNPLASVRRSELPRHDDPEGAAEILIDAKVFTTYTFHDDGNPLADIEQEMRRLATTYHELRDQIRNENYPIGMLDLVVGKPYSAIFCYRPLGYHRAAFAVSGDQLGDVMLIEALAQAPRAFRARFSDTRRVGERLGAAKAQVSGLRGVRVSGK